MNANDVRQRLDAAVARLVHDDGYLLANNLGERCIAARLAIYVQHEFPEHSVDAEYNRDADTPKRLYLPEDCANYRNEYGENLRVPDVIAQRRRTEGPHIRGLE